MVITNAIGVSHPGVVGHSGPRGGALVPLLVHAQKLVGGNNQPVALLILKRLELLKRHVAFSAAKHFVEKLNIIKMLITH